MFAVRSASLLLLGLLLLGAGVAVTASDLPGRWWVGATLVLVGLLVKVAGFLTTDDPSRTTTRPNGRRVTTLDGRLVEMPRAGVPAGRGAAIRRAAAMRRRGVVEPPPAAPPTRRAS